MNKCHAASHQSLLWSDVLRLQLLAGSSSSRSRPAWTGFLLTERRASSLIIHCHCYGFWVHLLYSAVNFKLKSYNTFCVELLNYVAFVIYVSLCCKPGVLSPLAVQVFDLLMYVTWFAYIFVILRHSVLWINIYCVNELLVFIFDEVKVKMSRYRHPGDKVRGDIAPAHSWPRH
jgi:hypothetical protein